MKNGLTRRFIGKKKKINIKNKKRFVWNLNIDSKLVNKLWVLKPKCNDQDVHENVSFAIFVYFIVIWAAIKYENHNSQCLFCVSKMVGFALILGQFPSERYYYV